MNSSLPVVQTEEQRAFAAYNAAVSAFADRWVPACGGTETPFFARSGAKLLYVFNPRTGKHAYLRVDGDIILTDEEASLHLALR